MESHDLILAYGPPPGGGGYGPPPGGGYGPPPPGVFGGGPPPGGYGGGGFAPGGATPPPMGPGFNPPNSSNGLALGALITGVLAIPTTCCCSFASLPLAIAACVMGGLALSKVKTQPQIYGGKGMALAGLICGIIALLMAIASLAFGMSQVLIDEYNRTQ